MAYTPEPKNLTEYDVRRIIRDTLQSQSAIDAYAPKSIPWVSVIGPETGEGLRGATGTLGYTVGLTAPDGALLADGSAVTGAYPALRQMLVDAASPFGTSGGDPLLPDLIDNFVAGAGNLYAAGDTGGAASVALTIAELAQHQHSGPSHTHGATGGGVFVDNLGGGAANITTGGGGYTTSATTAAGGTGLTGTAGSGDGHENLPPYVGMTPFIWT
jgi:microcystin-dependent protein